MSSNVTHHRVEVNGTWLHYVAAGVSGPPVLLVHGFPETWWAFHDVIPILAADRRVFAVDLRGFGDSDQASASGHDSATVAEDLHQLIAHLGAGPVHLVGQDLSGAAVFRLAATHPADVISLTGIETGLPGFGVEALADVGRGGAWYIGALAAPGVPDLFFTGREREFLRLFGFGEEAVEEYARTYARPGAWHGAAALYRSMLSEGPSLRDLAESHPVRTRVQAIGSAGGPFTATTLAQATGAEVVSAHLDGVGHYAALEAPDRIAELLLTFTGAP